VGLGLFLAVFGAFIFLVGIMAIGVIMGRRPISGSCGGIGRLNGDDGECALCGGDPSKCDEAINEKSVVGNMKTRATVRTGAKGKVA
tara:strand:+ start:1172 stop:1432 length:261 start_codon:yes stop_codon:yes gene_type:complete